MKTDLRAINQHLLPGRSPYRATGDAHHFGFLPLCGDGAIELLAESNEEFVYQEFAAKSRPAIHAETLQVIAEFPVTEQVLRIRLH